GRATSWGGTMRIIWSRYSRAVIFRGSDGCRINRVPGVRSCAPPISAAPPEALVGAAATLIGFAAGDLTPLIQHAEGGPALKLEGGARDPLVAAYLAAVARAAQYVNQVR